VVIKLLGKCKRGGLYREAENTLARAAQLPHSLIDGEEPTDWLGNCSLWPSFLGVGLS
jgi:hypothetical protein